MILPNIENFIGCDSSFEEAEIVLYGAPFDSTTSFRPGARFGPSAIRHESFGLETYSPYQDRDLMDIQVFDSGVMSPVVQGTAKMLEAETLDMNRYREQKDKLEYEAMMRNPETAYLVSNEEFDKQLEELGWSPGDMVTMAGMYIERGMYNMKKGIRDFFREILELMFQAAALVIDTIRTFFLVVLAILGPIAFAISVWDGFQSTLTQWICRYIQVYLWLPVSDMFSTILAKIQVLMLQSDIERMQADPNFSLDSSDGVYIVFMIIGIIGYFTIPTVAGWIIQAGGMGSYGRNVNQTAHPKSLRKDKP